jgi:putative GTP pyrophosphokinase
MADSKTPDEFNTGIDKVLAEFEAKEDILVAFCARTKSLIEASLQDANIRYQSVQTRVKTKKKLCEKYLDPTKNYEQLDDITDLAGLRVITYYEDEIDQVARVIEREFDVDRKNSVDKRQSEPDRFGYNALNYVCKHLPKRTSDVEYKKFSGVCCEIQITSILRHAWAEIEHEWYDLKDAYPNTVKRRFYRILALLELAESEFLDIRKKKTEYVRSVSVRVEARVPDLPTDAVSLRPFIEQEPIVADLDRAIASLVHRELTTDLQDVMMEHRSISAKAVGMTTLQRLRDALTEHRTSILEFVGRSYEEFWVNVSPAAQAPLSRGVCIYQLSIFLTGVRGNDKLREFLKTYSPSSDVTESEIASIVAIAQQIAAKHT